LSDTTTIEIKPITVLLGKNSAGKSTFLRSFPLLRQSSEQKTINDILWFGDYVDFGSFDISHNRDAVDVDGWNSISFSFELEHPIDPSANGSRYRRLRKIANDEKLTQKYTVHLKQVANSTERNGPVYSEYTIEADGNSAVILADNELIIRNLMINGEDVTEHFRESTLVRLKSLLPGLDFRESEDDYFGTQLFNRLRKLVHHKVSDENVRSIQHTVYYGPPEFILIQLREADLGQTWKTKSAGWNAECPEVKDVSRLLFAIDFETIFDTINAMLTSTFLNVSYITPLRASAERYYRLQGLAIDEISPNGENLAMYLKSLSEAEAEEFANWTKENMGFSVRVESHAGHVSIVIEDSEDNSIVNLADVGFGYSQVIPILAQMWQMQKRRQRFTALSRTYLRQIGFETPIFLLIEQPELHLHPKMQGRLAHLLVRSSLSARSIGVDLRIIIETHSETIIGKLGSLVSEKTKAKNLGVTEEKTMKMLDAHDVGIYLFERDKENSLCTKIVRSGFDKDGLLNNWPYDFFDGVH